jgi:hypothetical protein
MFQIRLLVAGKKSVTTVDHTRVPIFISESKSSNPLTIAASFSFVEGCFCPDILHSELLKISFQL